MLETFTLAFATFFATVGPIDVAAMLIILSPDARPQARSIMALRGTVVAAAILVIFALIGHSITSYMGISLAALRTAGGILLLLIGIDMAFARSSGGTSTTADEAQEATGKNDISVFPLATPIIAGPGAMGAAILLMADAEGHITLQATVVTALLAVMLFTYVAMLGANYLQQILGVTGMHVITRVFGVLLSALAVQFMFDGIHQSGLL